MKLPTNPFEDELKKALARCEPPEGFTELLAARIGALPKTPARKPYWRWGAVAAAAAMLFSAGVYQHDRYLEGEAAKEKLLIAMRITSSKLQQAQQQIEQVERNK